MLSPEEENRIERLTKSLYSRKNQGLPNDDREPISKSSFEVREAWAHDSETPGPSAPQKTTLFKKILIASLIFFVLSSGVAAFMFLGGFNVISSANVNIVATGPVSVAGGSVLPLEVTVQNNNNIDMQTADITVEYPDGTKSPDDVTADFPRYRESLGPIASGKSAVRTVKAVLFGEENSTEDIKISLDYTVKGSNATFSKQKTYTIALGTPPISIAVDALKEINSGQDIQFAITLTSNSSTAQNNIIMTGEYPFGFTFTSPKQGDATNTPAYDQNVWNIGTLNPTQKKTILVKGKLEGQDGEDRTFRFNVGVQDPNNPKKIQTTFVTAANTIAIKRPFIGVKLALDGDISDNHVVDRASVVRGEIDWQNNLPTQVTGAEIDLKLNGSIIDKQSIVAYNGGFYRSIDNTIVWDKTNAPALNTIDPGASGSVAFSFSTLDMSDTKNALLTNPQVAISIDVSGKRLSDSNVPEAIVSSVARTVKVASKIAAVARNTYSTGPFANTGPIPPKADKPTTYTATWTVTNASNDVANVRAVASLPNYVKWTGSVSPAAEQISFNENSRQIVWQIGSLAALTGYRTPPKQVTFQVQLLPSIGQLNQVPELIGPVSLTADDTFVGESLKAVSDNLTTILTSDPRYGRESAAVTQ